MRKGETLSNCPILPLVHALALLAAAASSSFVDSGKKVVCGAIMCDPLTQWTTSSTSFLDKTGNKNWIGVLRGKTQSVFNRSFTTIR